MSSQPATSVLGRKARVGSRKSAVSRAIELEEFYRADLTSRYSEMVEDWRLYLGQKKIDPRKGNEKKWRADVTLPYPYSMTETLAAVTVDIMTSSDPYIQVEGIGADDEPVARAFEQLCSSTLQANKWVLQLGMMTREKVIQGTQPLKVIYKRENRNVWYHATPDEKLKYKLLINMVMQQAQASGRPLPPPPKDPVGFEAWRMNVNVNGLSTVQLPPMPVGGWRNTPHYSGPWIERTPIFDLRFPMKRDPLQPLPWVAQRIVKSRKWLKSMSGPNPWNPLDPDAVARAMGGWDGRLMSTWQDQIDQMMGIHSSVMTDPFHEDDVEILEVWEPGDEEQPFKLILNRQEIVNKNTNMPFGHGGLPYHWPRNLPIANQWLGMSEYQQSRRLFHEANTLRSLRLDSVVLQVMPIFLKMKDLGMTEAMKQIRPGMIIDAPRADAIKQLIEFHTNINDAFREINELKGDVDETAGTQGQVRGNAASIGRVSATENQSRLNQALVRSKDRVARAEDELSEIPAQMMHLWYQFGEPDIIVKAAGEDGAALKKIPREKMQDILNWDVRFRGASKLLNREIAVQQLKDLLATAAGAVVQGVQLITMKEGRKILTRIVETSGLKGIYEIITAEGTQELVRAQQAQQQAAAAQAQQQALAQQQSAQKPPSTSISYKDLPPEGQRQLAGQAGLQLQPADIAVADVQGGKGPGGAGTPGGSGSGGGAGHAGLGLPALPDHPDLQEPDIQTPKPAVPGEHKPQPHGKPRGK